MKRIIQNLIGTNPYRVLGVYVGDSIAKEASHRSRICAYAKVGQTADFSLKGDDRLPALVRKEEMADQAVQELSLSVSRLRYSLFWYADEKYEWASIINHAIDSLLSENLSDAIIHYDSLLQDEYLRNDFIDKVTHGIYSVDKERLSNILLETIYEHMENAEIMLKCNFSGEACGLGMIIFERWMREELEELTGKYLFDTDFYVMIDNLKITTDQIAPYINFAASVYGTKDYRYKDLAETVARRIYKQSKDTLSRIAYWAHETRSLTSVKLCRSLIEDVLEFVDKAIGNLALEEDSYKIIGKSVTDFEKEYFGRVDYIERLIESYKGKIDFKTLTWLCFLILLFLLLM